MRARRRDAIVVAVLATALFAAVRAWESPGPWVSLVLLVAGMLVAAGVYRARRPAVPLTGHAHPPPLLAELRRHEAERGQRASRRRPS
ncbi:MAG: hypothetical protein QOE37_1890 [Microbacteriaceae bacterium]|nr:hypothetical protein [Microbacteriaceae bacterium]